MSLWYMAWRNSVNRQVQTWITICVVMIGVAVSLAIMMLSGGLKQGIVQASEPYGMIVGAKGSANQLVFNTIFMMDNPLGNIGQAYYDKLATDARVKLTVPFALGDNYKGFRLVGTSPAFFDLKGRPIDPPYFRLASGRVFDKPFEAVIGAEAAEKTGLKTGDRFLSAHGVVQSAEPEEHKLNPYTVVGILHRVSAPSDRGIYVSLDSYWISHEHGHEKGVHAAADDEHAGVKGVTAALVKPNSYIDLMKLYQEINKGKDAQAVFPGQIISKIFDMMGNGEQVLREVAYVVLMMAGFTVALALYGSAIERRRTVAILRAIGAGRRSVMTIVIMESAVVMLIGCLLGVAAGYALTWALVQFIGTHVSVAIPIGFQWSWMGFVGGVALLGVVAGLFPAFGAYRTETARYLNAS